MNTTTMQQIEECSHVSKINIYQVNLHAPKYQIAQFHKNMKQIRRNSSIQNDNQIVVRGREGGVYLRRSKRSGVKPKAWN